MKNRIKLSFCLLMVANFIYAQSIESSYVPELPYNIPSPSASSLGSYGNIPVSGYTGKADVNVPLYKTSQRGIDLDIHLSYDTSGLLINQLPGWIGHGWNLLAGGAITRKINNLPDEISFKDTNAGADYYYKDYCADFGGYFGPAPLAPRVRQMEKEMNNINNYSNYFSNASIVPHKNNYKEFAVEAEGGADYSADIFYFDFMGIHGSFFYGNDGKWKVKSDRNICVQFDVNDKDNYIDNLEIKHIGNEVKQPKTIKGFTLVDDMGVKYVFGNEKNAIEYSTNLMSRHKYNTIEFWNAVTWMLTEVRDRFDNVLYTFKYSRGKNVVQLLNSYVFVQENGKKVNPEDTCSLLGCLNSPVYLDVIKTHDGTRIFFNHSKVYDDNSAYKHLYPNFKFTDFEKMIKKSYSSYIPNLEQKKQYELDEIFTVYFRGQEQYFKDDLIEMNLEKLNSVVICNNSNKSIQSSSAVDNNDILEKYSLQYGFDGRMHLTSLTSEVDGVIDYYYNFDYYDYDMIPADYITTEYDNWGYYNGKRNDILSGSVSDEREGVWSIVKDEIKNDYAQLNVMDKVKYMMPNVNFAKMGMLSKITYPTGGESVFDYELNTCSSALVDNKTDVVCFDKDIPVGGLRIKSVSNYGDGKLIGKKVYEYSNEDTGLSSGILYSLPNSYYKFNKDDKEIVVNISCSIIPLSNSFYPSIGYSFVREKNIDGSYVDYEFSNYDTEKDEKSDMIMDGVEFPNPFMEFSRRDYMCGKLLKKSIYDSDARLVELTENEYTSDRKFNSSNYVYTTGFTRVQRENENIYIGSRYKLFYPKVSLKQSTQKKYFGNCCVTSVLTNQYLDGVVCCSSVDNKNYYANVRHLVSERKICGNDVVKTEFTYPSFDMGDNRQLEKDFYLPVTAKKFFLNDCLIKGNRTYYGLYEKKYVPKYDVVFSNIESNEDTIMTYKSYTENFRPAEIIDGTGVKHSYFWDVKDRIISVIDNSQIDFDRFVLDANDVKPMVKKCLIESNSFPVEYMTCSYNTHGQISEIQKSNDLCTLYDYDSSGRLVCEYIEGTNGKKQQLRKHNYNYTTKVTGKIIEYAKKVDAMMAPYIMFYDAQNDNTAKRDEWDAMTPVEKYTAIENDYHDKIIFCDGRPVQYLLYSTLHPVWWKKKTNKGNYVIGWAEKDCILHGGFEPAKALEGRGFLLIDKDRNVIRGYIDRKVLLDETYTGWSLADLLQGDECIPDTASYLDFTTFDVTVGGTRSDVEKMRRDAWAIVMLNDEYYPYFSVIEQSNGKENQSEPTIPKENSVEQIGFNQYSVTFANSYDDVIIEVYDSEGYLVGVAEKDKVKCGDSIIVITEEPGAAELTVFSGEDIILQKILE